MKKEIIEKIVGNGEFENLELKPSLSQMNAIVETISAFANTSGGKIIIGMSDSGKIKGVVIGKGTIEELTNKIIQNTEPKIQPRISVEKIESKNIIVIDVPESMDKLVLPYKRVGKYTNIKSSHGKIILVLTKFHYAKPIMTLMNY